ncbi:MAG: HlyD family efflux transporter periplasmic adaptor subunit [Saprospiraceae bacterium]
MLNISHNKMPNVIELKEMASYKAIKNKGYTAITRVFFLGLLLLVLVGLFLPWTQNINSKGYVTTRSPEQRPQSIQSVIGGRIQDWYVKEGDFVQQGDTIVYITEVKSEYFDPELLDRTKEQLDAKSQSTQAYSAKIDALEDQYNALKAGLGYKKDQINNKIRQSKNKITIDSIDLIAFEKNIQISQNQVNRTKELYEKGLKSLSDLQEKEYKLQLETAKVISQKNKLLNQIKELENLHIELLAIDKEYADKLAKSTSDRQTALSDKMENITTVSKLENQFSNYSARQKFYYITAPQSGYVTKAVKKGIGETLKEGDAVVTIMPKDYDLAIEVYVEPMDIPLLNLGKEANIRFDGWPAIVISGWPQQSTGIFKGTVAAIDRYISDNGKYRVFITPDEKTKPWPNLLSIGTGAKAFILLKKVPIWYEVWRQLNGFPPDFYDEENMFEQEVKRKAPIKSVK